MDSFSPRGLNHGVCYGSGFAGPLSRALDAYGARAFLATLPFVAPNHVAVMGMSHGGNSVLKAIDSPITAKVGVEPFQAAVVLYPNCDPNTEPNAPILILTGALDNVLDQTDCPRYLAKFGADHDVNLKVYPGAYHIFDIPGVDTLSRGHYVLRYHAEAANDAEVRIRAFLAKHLQ